MNSHKELTQQILGFSWFGENITLRPVCSIYNFSTSNIVKIELTTPYKFNWLLSKEKYCIGYHNEDGEYLKCPFDRVVEQKYDRCPNCAAADGFKQAFFFGDAPNARMEKYLAQDHYIYLAFFHPRTVKVGTAAAGRRYKRLLEQDALISMFIAKAPGNQIQQLERHISQNFAIRESISSRQKLSAIKLKPNSERALQHLRQTWSSLQAKLAKTAYADWLLPASEIEEIDQSANPHVFYPQVESNLHHLSDPQHVSGTFCGLRAKKLLTGSDLEKHIYVYSAAELVGRKFAVQESERILEKETPRQMQQSLFA